MCCSRMTIGQLLPNTKAIMLITSVSSSEMDKVSLLGLREYCVCGVTLITPSKTQAQKSQDHY